jgi:ABC-type antimicrobial peptide transport system permease subunit
MTLLGAAVGIAIYVAISAITNNLQNETKQVIDDYNSDITIQGKGAPSPLHSRIRAEDMAALKAMLGDYVDPMVVGALRESWSSYAMLLGIPPSMAPRFGLLDGKHPTAGGKDVMIGMILAQQLHIKPGDSIPLGDGSAKVTGIYNMGNRLVDGAVVADLTEAQRLLNKEGQTNIALVRIQNKGEIKKMIHEINQRFPRLVALSTADFVGNIRLFRTIDTFTRSVAIISFIGSCLVVTNTLLMAVSERTREVGILMAVGWRPWLVIRMLLAESLTLCLGGALAGNGMALLILKLLNNSRSVGFGWIPVTISPATFAASLLITIILALIATIWPALIIYRLSPVEALRYE